MLDVYIFKDWKFCEKEMNESIITNQERRYIQNYGNGRESILSLLLVKSVLGKVEVWRDERGKPFLVNDERFVNWSHNEDYWVLAVSREGPVGVDIESLGIDYQEEMYGWILHDEEKERMKQGVKFSEIWTRKEAYVKYLGLGMNEEMNKWSSFDKDFIKSFKFKNAVISVCAEKIDKINVYVDGYITEDGEEIHSEVQWYKFRRKNRMI
ncbi:4'-phosphopantetheinyl transferase family protein [Anoxybacillus kestanbolensis]|uniref:4'-phosphopantetheinyl transferase family protein n=1 Tax=Anoxybacillus kestanbolensis TaxID=227476 RepID=UPI000985A022|nr:4'-phosphopantetheinyl transferase superfamily protein [Anoxybacillus kestanbolensis]